MKAKICLCIWVLLFICTLVNGQIVTVKPSATEVSVNDIFDVSVDLSSGTEIYSAEVELSFDPSILEVTDATEGNFLRQDGKQTFFVKQIDNDQGKILIGNARIGNVTAVKGSGTLGMIKFKAKKEGESSLQLTKVKLLNQELKEIEGVSKQDSKVAVKPELSGVTEVPKKEEFNSTYVLAIVVILLILLVAGVFLYERGKKRKQIPKKGKISAV